MPERYWVYPLGEEGLRFWLAGSVRDTENQSISGARVEFWVADDEGQYHERKGRGWQAVGEDGFYQLHTVRPGNEEEGKAADIHVKVSAPGYKPLTTRLFFEDDLARWTDPTFSERRAPELGSVHWGDLKFQTANFDLILEAAEAAPRG